MSKHAVPVLGGNVSLWGVLRGEAIKFFALTSTRILVAVSILVMVGFAALVLWSVGMVAGTPAAGTPGMPDMASEGFVAEMIGSGLSFAQLIIGALAVLLMSGEFTTGSAVSTFLASPQRLRVLTAKALLMTGVTVVVGLASFALSYLVCKPLAQMYSMPLNFTSEPFQRAMWFGTLYLVMVTMIGLALGTMLRNSAGGITVLVALFFVVPIATSIIASLVDWFQKVAPFLPDQAGMSLALPLSYPSDWETGQQLLVVGGWMLIPLVLAGILLKARDI